LLLESRLLATPDLEIDRLPVRDKQERIGVLRDLVAELERTPEGASRKGEMRRQSLRLEMGLTHLRLSCPAKAIPCLEEVATIARRIGDRRGEGAALGNLGVAYYRLGQVDKAVVCYEQALVILREIGDRRGE